MKKLTSLLFLLLSIMACSSEDKPTETHTLAEMEASNKQPILSGEYQMVWSEEFDYEGVPDSTKWTVVSGDGCPELCGWGNNELQYYTNNKENIRVEDGKLVIEAHKAVDKSQLNNKKYSSAKLLSKGKGDWKYGKLLIKAKLPKGRGTWAAIWMLPSLDRPLKWPLDGEIDIMEHVGFDQEVVHGTIHTEAYNGMVGTQLSGDISLDDASETFHEYGVEWASEKLTWFVDGKEYFHIDNPHQTIKEWPFNYPFHLIFNLAVGGNWGGRKGVDDSIWPQRMEIDYVKVYQRTETTVAGTE